MGHREAREQAGGHEGALQRLEGGHRGGDGEPATSYEGDMNQSNARAERSEEFC